MQTSKYASGKYSAGNPAPMSVRKAALADLRTMTRKEVTKKYGISLGGLSKWQAKANGKDAHGAWAKVKAAKVQADSAVLDAPEPQHVRNEHNLAIDLSEARVKYAELNAKYSKLKDDFNKLGALYLRELVDKVK